MAWHDAPYKKGTPVGPATLPRIIRPPSPGEIFRGYDVLAYKRGCSHAGRWEPWAPSGWDNVYWAIFAMGKGTGNVGDSGIRGIERQEKLAENGVLDDILYQKMRRIRVPDGPHKGEPIFDGEAVRLLNLALKEFGPGSEERKIREAITDFCLTAEINEEIYHYCVPVDHRILTEGGYKYVDEVGDLRVAVIDPDTREIKFEPPLAINKFSYSGPMISIKSWKAEILCTPDHSWPIESYGQTQRGIWYPGHRSMRQAHTLNQHHAIPLTGIYNRSTTALTPRHAAILGWLVTDGTIWYNNNHLYGKIYQSVNRYVDIISSLVGRPAVEHSRTPQAWTATAPVMRIYVPREDMEIIERVYNNKSDLPAVVCKLNHEAAEAMRSAMLMGDGGIFEEHECFYQRPGPVMEAFQILNFLTGRCGPIRGPYPNGQCRLFTRNGDRHKWNGQRVEHWEGEVWCPTTSTGTWIVEHDGLLMPTGNTQQRPYTGLGVEPNKTHENDCSSYVILAYYWARKVTGVKVPDPSEYNYSGFGNTYDNLDGHERVTSGNYLVGDLAHYNGHVTICRKPGNADTSVWSSFGTEFGPSGLSLYYRNDYRFVVRPPLQ